MAVAAKKMQYEYGYAPATRVYSQTQQAAVRKTATPEQETRTRVERSTAPRVKPAKKSAKKLLALMCVGVTAAVMVVLLIRYAQIAESYSQVNELRDEIAYSEQRIATLNVELNSVISIDAARDAAISAGMGYPMADQIVRVSGLSATATDLAATSGGTGQGE